MAWTHQLGEEIAKARHRAGMSQADLKNAIGVSRQTIGLYETGKVPPPFETLAKIAAAVRADEFVVDELHVRFSRNGMRPAAEIIPQQLSLNFDKDGGVSLRIEPTRTGLMIKAIAG